MSGAASLSIADVLERAGDRLSKPGAWTRDVFARDAEGERVAARSKAAVCWCVMGAINAEVGEQNIDTEGFVARHFLRKFLGGGGLIGFNDAPGRTQAEVVAALRAAAAKAREGAQP